MKGYYEATRKKPQTVGEFLKKTSERNYASDQIYKHNMKEGTTKLKMTGDTIYYKSGGGYTAINMLHDPIMEMNALEAIRMVTPTRSHSIYPSLAQIYEVRRADERAILQNPENLNREVFLTQDLKTKLLKYKKESVDMYEKDSHWPSDENYSVVLDKEYAEIQWLQMFRGAQNDFFNSEYVRGFGLVFQYNPPENQGQNQPLPLPQAPNHNPEPNPDEEDVEMLKELRAQLEQMRQEIENKNNDLADKDKALEDKNNIISEKENKNLELTNKLEQEKAINEDLSSQLISSRAELMPLKEKVSELKIENKELKDEKTELKDEKKILFEEKKIALDEKKLLVEEKKYYFDLSKEQSNKIILFEQIHCNVPEHKDWVPISGAHAPEHTD